MAKNSASKAGSNGAAKGKSGQKAKGETRIALVLDSSGSMAVIRDQAREAFNEAIERVTGEAGEAATARLTLLTFNQDVTAILENAPVKKARKLEPADYRPGGCTALLDAVGQAIDTLAEPGPLGDDDAALVIVVTDGHENSSRHVSHSDLVERMQALKETGGWTFTFMCADVDINDLSRNLGVDRAAFASFSRTTAGAEAMGHDVAGGVREYLDERRGGMRQKVDFWKK